MGTHPIFESDFDCLTDMVGFDMDGLGGGSGLRNAIASVVSGLLFFTGWWIAIDAAVRCNVTANPELEMYNYYHICGVIGTLAFFMINTVSNAHLSDGSMYEDGCLGAVGARIWLLVGFLGAFGAVIASLCVLFAAYVAHPPVVPDDKMGYCPTRVYPGLAIFLQNFFIFLGSVAFKFGRQEE